MSVSHRWPRWTFAGYRLWPKVDARVIPHLVRAPRWNGAEGEERTDQAIRSLHSVHSLSELTHTDTGSCESKSAYTWKTPNIMIYVQVGIQGCSLQHMMEYVQLVKH